MDDHDGGVLIVGAGPVGLTLAIALTRLGVPVRIIDKAPHTKRQPRAAVIWQRTLEALADLGAVDGLLQAGALLHGTDIFAFGRHVGHLEVGSMRHNTRFPFPLMIEQHDTERVLADHLASLGVPVEWETEAVRVQQADSHCMVDLRRRVETSTVRSSWVVGCEGTSSLVRKVAGIEFAGGPRHGLDVVQINAIPGWDRPRAPHHGYFFLAPHTALGVFPLPGHGYRFFAFRRQRIRQPDPDVAAVTTIMASATHEPNLTLERTEPAWINRAHFQDRIAASLRSGRLLLAGDAAHAWAPIGGHGMNAGMVGAHNLAWKLAAVINGQGPDALLDSYSHEQRKLAHSIIAQMRFNPVERPLPGWLLAAIAPLLALGLRSSAVGQRFDKLLSDLGRRHANSPISGPRTSRSPLAPGDRLPDAAVVTPSGQTTTYALRTYDRWTLLNLRPQQHDRPQRAALDAIAPPAIDVQAASPTPGPATDALGSTHQHVLVRPDGHVAAVVADTTHLRDYVRRWLFANTPDSSQSTRRS